MRFWCIIFGFICNLQLASAQQASFFNLGKEQFEGVQIYDVIQDKNFNYWFATDKGFYKYDCHTFQKIHCPEMKGFAGFGFVINKEGTIYCYNINNQILKIKNDTCSVFYELKDNERGSDIFLVITSENDLLVVTRTALVLDKMGKPKQILESKLSFTHNYYYPFQTKTGKVIAHYTNGDSLLVIDKNKVSLQRFSHDASKIDNILTFFRIDGIAYAISNPERRLYLLDEETLHLTTVVEKLPLETKSFFRFYNENNLLWLTSPVSGIRIMGGYNSKDLSDILYPQYFISDVYKDNEGNLLLSTFNNGVLVVPNLNIPDVLKLPENQSIISVHQDNELGTLMGTLDGQLVRYDNDKNEYQTISKSGMKPLQTIISSPHFPYIIFDDGKIKIYHKKTGKIIPVLNFSLKDAVIVDKQTICFALNIGVRKIIQTKPGIFVEKIISSLRLRTYSLEIDPLSPNIFVATSDGLKILQPNDSVESIFFKGEPLFANDIYSDGKMLCVSTQKHGILFFEKGVIVRQVIPKINQIGIEIHKLLVYNQKIYTVSSHGVFVLDMNGVVITQLNMKYGFSSNKIFDFKIIDDHIWISHSKGVQKINIHLVKNNTEKPLLKIAHIKVNDKFVQIPSMPNSSTAVIFNSDQRKFQFTIASPTLHNRESIKYYYQLVGYDTKWLAADYNNYQISYNALASGDYTFLVKAENQGVFSETIRYPFTILSPFYLRWWFIATEIILFLLIVALIYRWQLNIQRRKSAQINELNASKLTAIQSQMNPHFIFNSLNSIQDLILKGDIENSYSYITTFANMVRRTLNYSGKDFIDIEQEIELLELYLSLEKLRFKKDLQYKINFEEGGNEPFSNMMIPPLLIQPFIENALVHGLLHKEGLKEISISFRFEQSLTCVIEDNGIGREKARIIRQRQRAEHEPFSSDAIYRRFEIFSNVFNGKFGYFYEDLYHGEQVVGTRVTLKIPVKHKF